MTCIVFVFRGILSPCDWVGDLSETETGGFTCGMTDSLLMRVGPALSLLSIANQAAWGCGLQL